MISSAVSPAVSQAKITTFFSSGETKTSEQSQNKDSGDSYAESSSSYDTEYESDLNAVSDFSTESTPAKSPQEKPAAAAAAAVVNQSQENKTKKKKRKRKH